MPPHTFNQITSHVYWLSPDSTTDRPILGAVSGTKGALLVDAGNSPAHIEIFLKELAGQKIAPPKFAMLTHWHWDHIFGLTALDLPTFAFQETKQVVAEMAGWDWRDAALDERVAQGIEIEFCRDMIKAELPDRSNFSLRVPEIGFTGQVELDLGGVTAQIIHVGGDHAADSSIVYIPEDKVIFLGDCIYQNLYHNPPCYTVDQLFPLIDRLLGYEAGYYLLAHAPEPLTRVELSEFTDFLKLVGQTVTATGADSEAILGKLSDRIAPDFKEDLLETVDAFIAGLPG